MAVRDHYRIKSLESQLDKYQAETVTEHHVEILGELDDGDFAYKSDEEPQGGVFRPCPSDIANHLDVPALLRSGIGYVAVYASWEERGTCKSILRADLRFAFRDETTDFKHRRVSR